MIAPASLTYDVALARALDDVVAAIYLAVLFDREALPGLPVFVTTADIVIASGARAEQVARARQHLVREGVLSISGSKGTSLGHVIVQDVLYELLAADIDDRVSLEEPDAGISLAQIDPREIVSGRYDVLRGARALDATNLLDALLGLWARTWGKRGQPKITKERATAFRRAFVVEKRTPSEVAKAILGMAEDDWAQRADHCDLAHVVKHLERWVELWEAVRSGARQSKRSAGGTIRCKTVKGHAVPEDYDWTREDDACASAGHHFDLASRKWVAA